jgi:hypothetical protein
MDELARMQTTVQAQIDAAREKKKARKKQLERKAAAAEAAAAKRAAQKEQSEEEHTEGAEEEEEEHAQEPTITGAKGAPTQPTIISAAALSADDKAPLVRQLLSAALPVADALDSKALSLLGDDDEESDANDDDDARVEAAALANVHEDLVSACARLGRYLSAVERAKKKQSTAPEDLLSCRRYRRATMPLMRLVEQEQTRLERCVGPLSQVQRSEGLCRRLALASLLTCALFVVVLRVLSVSVLSSKEKLKWLQVTTQARKMCR